METKIEVKKFIVDQICDSCKDGRMRPHGMFLIGPPTLFPHRCNKCNWESAYMKEYPYEEIQMVSESM